MEVKSIYKLGSWYSHSQQFRQFRTIFSPNEEDNSHGNKTLLKQARSNTKKFLMSKTSFSPESISTIVLMC